MGRIPLLIVFAFVAAGGTFGHTSPHQGATAGCAFTIHGTWKPETTVEANPLLLSFSADGWVNVLNASGEGSVHDLDIESQVQYRIDTSSTPARIEFSTRRGDDVFPPGKTSWDLLDVDDRVLIAVDRKRGEPSRWVRVETHRYYLTLAERRAANGAEGAAIAMWTKLDGRRPELAALGLRERVDARGERTVVFGRIPPSLAGQFATEGGENTTMLRMELTESEYSRTRAVFNAWSERPAIGGSDDAARSALAFLGETAASLNRCAPRIQMPGSAPAADDAMGQAWDFVRQLRRLNDRRHVADAAFPFTWQPQPVK